MCHKWEQRQIEGLYAIAEALESVISGNRDK